MMAHSMRSDTLQVRFVCQIGDGTSHNLQKAELLEYGDYP